LVGLACVACVGAWGQNTADKPGQTPVEKPPAPRVHRLGDYNSEEAEWEPGNFNFPDPKVTREQQLDAAEKLLAQGVISGHGGNNALRAFLHILEGAPKNSRAMAGLAAVRRRLQRDFSRALEKRQLASARSLLKTMVKARMPAAKRLDLAGALSVLERARALYDDGRKAETASRLRESAAKAVDLYRQALKLDNGLDAAKKAISNLLGRLVTQSRAELAGGDFREATALIDTLEQADPGNAQAKKLRAELLENNQKLVAATLASARTALQARKLDLAQSLLAPLQSGGNAEAGRLLEQVDILRRFGSHRPGDTFYDTMAAGEQGPEMLVLPTGNFRMGAPAGAPGYTDKQGPRVAVRLATPIALEKTETTVLEFSHFVEATGYLSDAERGARSTIYDPTTGSTRETDSASWRDNFLGKPAKGNEPVIHVSWRDAQAYTRWLSEQTGEQYRLPSEAEFEYALRGGTTTAYWWGDEGPRELVENLAGGAERFQHRNYWPLGFRRYNDKHWGPARVESFKPNPFGFYDIGGNVAEWTMDCFLSSLEGRPGTAVARLDGPCGGRVVKGGFWSAGPSKSGSASRFGLKPDVPDNQVGFRVVRELNPVPSRQIGSQASGS